MDVTNQPHRFNFLLRYALSLALWSLFALVIAGYYNAMMAPASERFGFGIFFLQMVVVLTPFALITPLAFRWCSALYRSSRTRLEWSVKHLGLCVLWYVTANTLAAPFQLIFWNMGGTTFWDVLLHPNTGQFLSSVGSFWIVAATAMLAAAFQERQQRETALARVRAQLSDTKLQNLRYQLNPHFLFNSINAAVSFVRTGRNQSAERMLLALAELMDAYLSPQTPLTMTLAEELDLLRKYLEIEMIRFGDKLRLELDIQPGSETVQVPSMLLQPLLENAVRHGIARLTKAGVIRLRTCLDGDELSISIFNDVGPEQAPNGASENGHGMGLSLTRARLAEAYRQGALLQAGPQPGGYLVTIRLPADGGGG